MRLLVFGAGVIGSYVCHVLCEAGHEVSLAARGAWAEQLRRNGLVIRHVLQRRTTTDHPRIVAPDGITGRFDAVFAVLQAQQLEAAIPILAAVDTQLLVLIGNDTDPAGIERALRARCGEERTILFGFSGTGGHREKDHVECIRFGAAELTCGCLHAEPDASTKESLARIFTGRYRPSYQQDMEGWLRCHLAFILPVAYLCYRTDCDLRRSTAAERRLVLDAAGEADDMLAALGVRLQPEGEREYYRPGMKRTLMSLLLAVMAKTRLGDLAASDHCRAAVAELRAVDACFAELRSRAGDPVMPAWDRLREALPGWDELEERYRRQ